MTAALALAARTVDRANVKKLAAWALCWIILPNAGFWLLWTVGAPPRAAEILAIGTVGLLMRNRRYVVKLTAFMLLLIYSILSFIAALFNLAITSLLASLQFLVEMRPGASIEYIVCVVGIFVTIVASIRVLRIRTDFQGTGAMLGAIALVLGAAGLDQWMSFGMRGAYKRSAPNGAPFGSAVQRSGFVSGAATKRDLVLVIVESMGQPVDPVMRARLIARWKQPDVASRYTLTQGTTPYFGSTTSGEIRDLCGRWGDYYDLLDRKDDNCLPARLDRAGYQTAAFHSFDGSFFKRDVWYPHIGFEQQIFREALLARGASGCPGVFPGACDRDVPKILYEHLKASHGPQFVYWLTVNSHLPVPSEAELHTKGCSASEPSAVQKYKMICRQFELWEEVENSLAEQMVKPDFPDADILLVGDHMPPYFDRAQRSEFDPAEVPWMLLRRKPRAETTQVATPPPTPTLAAR